MDTTKLSGLGRKYFHLIEFDDNEVLIREIRKHPIGMVGIYLTGLFVAAALLIVLVIGGYFLNSDALGSSGLGALQPILVLVGGILALVALAMTAVGAYIYQSNVIFVTSEKVAQVVYRTIFDRKISQLNINNVQDVTVAQRGILANIFKYGTITIETAGEQQNYTFTFVPDPYGAARDIVGAHEKNVEQFGN